MNQHKRARGRRPKAVHPLVFSLLGTAEAVQTRLEAALRRLGLSLAKAGVLMHLAEAGESLPLHELAERQSCVRSNITQLVDRLEKDGLVRRGGDPADRRSIRASLTPTGKRAYARARQVLGEEQRAIVGALSARDTATVERALRSLSR